MLHYDLLILYRGLFHSSNFNEYSKLYHVYGYNLIYVNK